MRIGAFVLKDPLPELKEPHALAMLRPWVDSGGVGSLVLGQLESHFGAVDLGKLERPGTFFDFTRYRPTYYFKEGRREIEIPNASISYAVTGGEHDLLFLHLLEPHMLGELYAESVLGVLERLGVSRYCLIGSMYDLVPHTRPLIVSGMASDATLEQKMRTLNVKPSTYEGPTSITVLVSLEGARHNMDAMSLIVHLPQYAQMDENYLGQHCLLDIIQSLYGFKIDLSLIAGKAESQRRQLDAAVESSAEARQIVRQLEARMDAQASEAGKSGETSPPLSPEVEKFLREVDKKFRDE